MTFFQILLYDCSFKIMVRKVSFGEKFTGHNYARDKFLPELGGGWGQYFGGNFPGGNLLGGGGGGDLLGGKLLGVNLPCSNFPNTIIQTMSSSKRKIGRKKQSLVGSSKK